MKFFDPKKERRISGPDDAAPTTPSYQPPAPVHSPSSNPVEVRTPSAPPRSVTQTVIGSSLNVKGDIRSEGKHHGSRHRRGKRSTPARCAVLVLKGRCARHPRRQRDDLGSVIGNVTATNKVDLLPVRPVAGQHPRAKAVDCRIGPVQGSIDMSARRTPFRTKKAPPSS